MQVSLLLRIFVADLLLFYDLHIEGKIYLRNCYFGGYPSALTRFKQCHFCFSSSALFISQHKMEEEMKGKKPYMYMKSSLDICVASLSLCCETGWSCWRSSCVEDPWTICMVCSLSLEWCLCFACVHITVCKEEHIQLRLIEYMICSSYRCFLALFPVLWFKVLVWVPLK